MVVCIPMIGITAACDHMRTIPLDGGIAGTRSVPRGLGLNTGKLVESAIIPPDKFPKIRELGDVTRQRCL